MLIFHKGFYFLRKKYSSWLIISYRLEPKSLLTAKIGSIDSIGLRSYINTNE